MRERESHNRLMSHGDVYIYIYIYTPASASMGF